MTTGEHRTLLARNSPLTRQRIRSAWLFLTPLLLVLVAGWPLLRTVWFYLTDAKLAELSAAQFIGLDNYRALFDDPDWWQAVRNTLIFAGASVGLETRLGLAIAPALNALFPGRGLMRAAILVPLAIPTMVSAKMWGWMYNDLFGTINHQPVDGSRIASLNGRIMAVEHLGSESYLYVEQAGGAPLVVKSPGHSGAGVGEHVSVGIPAHACHFFDADGVAVLARLERRP